jgi:hypothetical protein
MKNILNKNLNKEYFFCYNQRVAAFLKSKGIGFITVAKDMNTGKVFSLYPKSQELQASLDEYKALNE